MRFRVNSSFPTLVLTALVTIFAIVSWPASPARAATDSPSPDFTDAAPADPPLTDQQKEFKSATDIAPQPPGLPVEARRLGYFHKYRHGLSLMGAYGSNTKLISDREGALSRISLLYLFHIGPVDAYEVGADLVSDGTGAIALAYRWIFSRTDFRPYTRAGLSVRIEPNDQLATFLRYRYYRAFGAAGFEKVLFDPLSFRFEAQAGATTEMFDFSLGAGLVWAW